MISLAFWVGMTGFVLFMASQLGKRMGLESEQDQALAEVFERHHQNL